MAIAIRILVSRQIQMKQTTFLVVCFFVLSATTRVVEQLYADDIGE